MSKEIKGIVLNVFKACELGLVEEVEKILKNPPDKFDINELDQDGYSLLMIACKTGNDDIVKLLLSNGIDVNIKGTRDMTALLVVCQNGYLSTAQLLLDIENIDLTATDINGNNALMYASMNGSFQIAELLIKKEMNVNHTNKNKGTALSFGVLYGKENLVEYLLSNGANIDSQDQHGNTAMHFAATCGYSKIITLLKTNGAKMDVANEQCKTPKQMSDETNILKLFEDQS
eukprot:40912_1